MKMTKIALIVAGMCAASAYAQDAGLKVNLYGTIDAAYATATNQATANTSPARIISGGDAPSIFGATGSKQLGNGMTASVTYEGDVSSASGAGSLFTRSANMALSGGFGTIRAGRQYDPAFLAFAATDPRGASMNNSGLQAWAVSAGTATLGSQTAAGSFNGTSTANIFTSNTVSYTNSVGGLSGTLAFGTGNSTTDNTAGNVTSLGLTYANGPLTVSGGTVTNSKSSTTVSTTTYANNPSNNVVTATTTVTPVAGYDATGTSYGAAYTMGNLRVAANYLEFKTSNNSVQLQTTGLGGTYNLGGGLVVNAAMYSMKDKVTSGNADTTTFGLSYALDKQVTMYAQIGSVATSSQGVALVASGAAAGSTGMITDNSSGYTAVTGKTVQTMFLGTRVSF